MRKIIRHCTVCVCRFMYGGWYFFCLMGQWLILFTAIVIGCNKCDTNTLLDWSSPLLAGRSSFLMRFMACQQCLVYITYFVLICSDSGIFVCRVCRCRCVYQTAPSRLTSPFPVHIAITWWRTLNRSNLEISVQWIDTRATVYCNIFHILLGSDQGSGVV